MDIGARLRLAREQQGKSVRDVAEATKISAATVDALEKNDFSRLPGGIFARAFVRSCAQEVGLDPERLVQDFIERFPSAAPESIAALEAAAPSRVSFGFKWLAIVGVLAVLAVAATGLYFWVADSLARAGHPPSAHRGSR
jgi:cytoskeletal protein RodZ